MSLDCGDRVIDKEYLALLEHKLQSLKDPKKATVKQFLSDIASYRDHQLFKLITADSSDQTQGFDDDFADVVITPSYLRKVVAPQTCAINKQELVHLVKSDLIQKLHEAADEANEGFEGDNEFDFVEKKFLPFPESNQILIIRQYSSPSNECATQLSSPIHTCLINAYGRLQFIEESKVVCLPKLLLEMSLKNGHSIELACADISAQDSEGCLAILATCWVELNEHFCPCRYFGAVFKISPTLHIEMTSKVEVSAPVAHCSLIDKSVDGTKHKYWIKYVSGKCICVHEVEDSGSTSILEDPSTVLPDLTAIDFPGTVTRSSTVCSEKLKWSALGFDTGRVILTVFDTSTKKAQRKEIKFSGPISVVEFVPYVPERTPKLSGSECLDPSTCSEERFLVVSSTLGPVAIWRCVFEVDDELSWSNEFVLSQSEQFDTITSACIINGSIAIGTYCGKILLYPSPYDILCHEITSMTQVHAPIVNMKVLDYKRLCVLSTAGLHTVTRSDI
ncbi:hypothetical protein GCK32_006238 [Trichostrongylus colubriformis]|uniref:Uncharacterized protein n=1 Tax=Trichostrongylus colubriformis TaxID=6319 RepID=A0AAN8FVS4_TRICO